MGSRNGSCLKWLIRSHYLCEQTETNYIHWRWGIRKEYRSRYNRAVYSGSDKEEKTKDLLYSNCDRRSRGLQTQLLRNFC